MKRNAFEFTGRETPFEGEDRLDVWGTQNHQAVSLKRPETERVKLESVKPHLYKNVKVDCDCGWGEELKHQRDLKKSKGNQGHDGGE